MQPLTTVRRPGGFLRVAGLSGLGFALLLVSVNAVLAPAGLPLTGAETSEVTAFFSSRRDLVGVASAFVPLVWILATLFGAGAVAALWRSDREHGAAWSLVGFAGVLMQNLTFGGVMATRLALASAPDSDAATTSAIWALHESFFIFNGTFLALAMLGLSLGGRQAGLIRPWHSTLGLLAGALQLASAVLSPLVMDDPGRVGLLGLAGWLLWVAWIAVYGVVLLRWDPQPAESARIPSRA